MRRDFERDLLEHDGILRERRLVKDIQDKIDDRLDAALNMTFPASDPIAVSTGDGGIPAPQTSASCSVGQRFRT